MRSDEELMDAYVRGDPQALRELFQRHAPTLLRVMRHQLARSHEAEDLVQQTFLQLHRARFDFKAGHRLKPWLFTIAMNLKREHFRRVKRRPEAPLDVAAPGEVSASPRGQEVAEAADAVHFALSQLPADQREVITLHWLGGMPLPEVSALVGASLSAVKVRAHRGYAAMRRILSSEPGNPQEP